MYYLHNPPLVTGSDTAKAHLRYLQNPPHQKNITVKSTSVLGPPMAIPETVTATILVSSVI